MNNLLPSKEALAMLIEAAERVEEIKTAAGVPPQVFGNFYQPVLVAFAEATQTLPLSKTAFSHTGGAFEFGLIACMIALRYAKSQVFFPDVGSEERRVLEPQCRYAAFVATLSSAVAMVAQSVSIHTDSEDDDYHPLVCPVSLHRWLRINPAARMKWKVGAQPLTSAQAAAIAARFIPNHLLDKFDLRVSLMIFGAIAPQGSSNGVETTIERVVRQTISKVIEHHVKEGLKRYESTPDAPVISTQSVNALAESMIAATKPIEPIDITKPASASTTPAPAPAPAPAVVVSVAPGVSSAPLLSTNEFMARLPQALREWFSAVIADPNYETAKTHFVQSELGIEIPAAMLGKYGVSGQTIQKLLKDSNVIIGRSECGRRYVLDPAIKEYLMTDSSNAT
ncbi:TraI domain-containing protein [Rugamonas sp. A1-17]|nr:TraI domain-containing protein [Rugamonas sp. A1-17]